jgi:hypothetical protein
MLIMELVSQPTKGRDCGTPPTKGRGVHAGEGGYLAAPRNLAFQFAVNCVRTQPSMALLVLAIAEGGPPSHAADTGTEKAFGDPKPTGGRDANAARRPTLEPDTGWRFCGT